jgi:hypothetical protein
MRSVAGVKAKVDTQLVDHGSQFEKLATLPPLAVVDMTGTGHQLLVDTARKAGTRQAPQTTFFQVVDDAKLDERKQASAHFGPDAAVQPGAL